MNFGNDFYVISPDFKLVDFNKSVADRYKGIKKGDYCYTATMNRSTPCLHCPIAGNSDSDCPIYYDPFYGNWVEAIFSQMDCGNYNVICRPADSTTMALLGPKVSTELAGKLSGQAVNNELKNLLLTRMSIIQAMSRIYFANYYVDIKEDTFIKLTCKEKINAILGTTGKASEKIKFAMKEFVFPEYQDEMGDFFDFSSMNERLADRDLISHVYRGVSVGWCKAYIIIGDREEDGSVRHVFIAFQEINEDKAKELKNQQELLNLTQVLVTLQNAMGAAMWHIEYNNESKVTSVYWSDELRHTLGYDSVEDFPNALSSITSRICHEDIAEISNIFRSVIQDRTGDSVFNVEYRLFDKHNQLKWYRIVGKPLVRDEGIPNTLYGLLIDIDEEKRKEIKIQDALKFAQDERNSLKTVHAAINSGRWGMDFDADANLVSCHWSHHFIDMVGYKDHSDFPNELGSWTRLIHPEDVDFVLKEYWDTIRDYTGVKTFDVKYRLETKDRGYRWFHTVGRLTRREDGSPVSYHGIFQDIDRQVKAELEVESQKEQLKKAVADAQRASKAKSEFLFNMSHDIRTPMNAIIGFADLLEKHGEDAEKRRDYTSKIQSSSRYLLELINNVLEMSRIESGKMLLDESTCRIDTFNDNLVSIMSEQIKDKNLTLIRKADFKTNYVICDATKIQEIMMNLLSNAIKYTPKGGTVTMTTTELPCDKPGYTTMETVIEDTGIGMSQDYLPHIFEEFSRGNNSTISRIIGTGLGMPITKKLVELMGGTINVESELGKGTKITVVLTHKIADNIIPEQDQQRVAAFNKKKFEGKRILLAEDNELNAEIAIEILLEVGFKVEHASDGVICVDMLQKAAPGYYDLILMDIQMPNLDGYMATYKIRRFQDQRKDIPIIAMTANAFDEDRYNALAAGMTAHVSKPIDVAKLLETMAMIL